tara:strand:- start:5032 stop:5286 length:255 start_codon:yes stop_codon:yes gene_type:complete
MSEIIITASEEFIDAVAERVLQKSNPDYANKIKTYTVADVAAIVGKTAQTIRAHIDKDYLKGTKVGKSYFFTQKQLDNYVNTPI